MANTIHDCDESYFSKSMGNLEIKRFIKGCKKQALASKKRKSYVTVKKKKKNVSVNVSQHKNKMDPNNEKI